MEVIFVQVEYGKLVEVLFPSHSSTTPNRAGNEIYTPHSFGEVFCGRGIPHRRAAAGRTSCCCSSSCLYVLDPINRAKSLIVIPSCQPESRQNPSLPTLIHTDLHQPSCCSAESTQLGLMQCFEQYSYQHMLWKHLAQITSLQTCHVADMVSACP